jgi:Chitin synthase
VVLERSKHGNHGRGESSFMSIFTVVLDCHPGFSLNWLVASSSHNSKIIGLSGEAKLTDEENSWWTMIQTYEYGICLQLSKLFESFGSFTVCIRTADKGRPIIISSRVTEEYCELNVDTPHENLFSLGERRLIFDYAVYETFADIQDQVLSGCGCWCNGSWVVAHFVFWASASWRFFHIFGLLLFFPCSSWFSLILLEQSWVLCSVVWWLLFV